MDAYRSTPPGPVHGDRLAFRDARIRIGADRFELSFAREWKHLALVGLAFLVMAGPFLSLVCIAPRVVVLALEVVAAGLTASVLAGTQHLVVTRHGAWADTTLFGVRISRHALGHHPKVDNLGWDWQELAVYPLAESLRRGLHDEGRFVLVEWADGDAARCSDGKHLQAIARAEILRLHGAPPTASSLPGSPEAPR